MYLKLSCEKCKTIQQVSPETRSWLYSAFFWMSCQPSLVFVKCFYCDVILPLCLFDRTAAMNLLPPGGSLRVNWSECDCLRTLIPSLCAASLTVCVFVLGCNWKERARTSVRSLAWCLRHQSAFLCGTLSYRGPNTAPSSRTPGNSLDPSLMWTQSLRMRPPWHPSSSHTRSALLVRMNRRTVSLLPGFSVERSQSFKILTFSRETMLWTWIKFEFKRKYNSSLTRPSFSLLSSRRPWQWDDIQRPAHKKQPFTDRAHRGPLGQPREVECDVPVSRGSHHSDKPVCRAPRGGPDLQAAGQRQQQQQLPHLPGHQQFLWHQGEHCRILCAIILFIYIYLYILLWHVVEFIQLDCFGVSHSALEVSGGLTSAFSQI